MAHYAILDENNIVQDVFVGIDETETAPEGFADWEAFYGDFHNCTVKRTSYNTYGNEHIEGGTPFRGNYAMYLGKYDSENDVFYCEQPFPSWSLDSNWIWQPPLNIPEDNETVRYTWNEEAYQADNSQGWELIE